jgi:hypothetical protein
LKDRVIHVEHARRAVLNLRQEMRLRERLDRDMIGRKLRDQKLRHQEEAGLKRDGEKAGENLRLRQ